MHVKPADIRLRLHGSPEAQSLKLYVAIEVVLQIRTTWHQHKVWDGKKPIDDSNYRIIINL
ncbi:MAG: hypothetical protein PHE74_07250 [Comamonas sp.]|nr:hypothetical protein [Comamonas sp.]